MEKRYRALRLVALVYRIVAWIALVGGILVALVIMIIGTLAGRAGTASPLLADVPVLNQVSGLISGIIVGIGVIVVALVKFVLLHAASEVIDLGLSIEENTRETARYLRGESLLPPPPVAPSA